MSLLGKYRREEAERDDQKKDIKQKEKRVEPSAVVTPSRSEKPTVSVPNKERKSPIMSFSIPTDLRDCLRTIRKTKAINLSMWVERQLREAVNQEFPKIAQEFLES
ncbi:MAG: hypothetical protein ACTSV3_01355 [Candidatus Thorarchaeota archaeon]|nr:MAG: hypothetical protein DRP09_07725 [Candidatus Thorarchaeota archaeon]